LQRTEMVMRIVTEIDRYICELGNEGRLISMQLEELIAGVEEDGRLVVEDYMIHYKKNKPDDILRKMRQFTYDELKEISNICNVLGYPDGNVSFDVNVSPKGYRLMKKIPRVPMNVVRNTVAAFSDLQGILKASIEDLDDVEGIGEVRARIIKDGLKRVRDQLFLDARY